MLGNPPDENLRFDESKFSIDEENSEGIYLEFDIPEDMHFTRVYIEGLGPVAEEIFELSTERGCFFYPFVEAEKEYTIRIVFLRDEDRDPNDSNISFGHRDDDGVLGWFETKVTAGENSIGEVRFTSKGEIFVDKKGNFKFTKRPTFQNEDLLVDDWEVDIGLVEGISWEHGAERWTKWHATQIPSTKLTETTNLYTDQENEGTEYSIDFICVRPIMHYTHGGKTYKYQWDSFVEDIFYPPIMSPDLINGIYLEYPVVTEEIYSRCDVIIDGIGKVAEMREDTINFLDSSKSRASFFYPFVEPGKKYTVRFSFKKIENTDGEFTIPTPDDTIIEYPYTVTVGAKSKGEVRLTSKGKVDAASTKQGNFKFEKKPTFQNEQLLGDEWMVELGLMEGISWEHGDERRTKWHCTVQIPNNKLDTETNLYKHVKESDSIDCICVRPILLNYEYKNKKYNYQWDDFVHDVYYPLRNPDGIYLELDLPKQKYSRCDVTIDGIGKVAEEVKPLEKNPARASFFYPFVEPNKEYTIRFSFKKPEPVDKDGFTIPTQENDTLPGGDVTRNVTAGPRAKGEVRPSNEWAMGVDDNYNLHTFEKFKAENEYLLDGKWIVEIGLMEGISWDHGDERRTKWHCAVYIPNESIHGNGINLRELCNQQNQHEPHEIDCICVRPIMYYTQDDKEYKYQWVGFVYDIYYPPRSYFEEIDMNSLLQMKKISGTWLSKPNYEVWDDYYNIIYNQSETLEIDSGFLTITSIYEIRKRDNTSFTELEQQNIFEYHPSGHIIISHLDDNCDSSIGISSDRKLISKKYVCTNPLQETFKNQETMWEDIYKLYLYKDGSVLRINREGMSYSRHEDYTKQ